jgi:hypothetical protein
MVRIPITPATGLMLGLFGLGFGIYLLAFAGGGAFPVAFGLILLFSGLSGLFSCISMRRNGCGWFDGR